MPGEPFFFKPFDAGYVTVTPDDTFRVSEALAEVYSNGKTYYALLGKKVLVPVFWTSDQIRSCWSGTLRQSSRDSPKQPFDARF